MSSANAEPVSQASLSAGHPASPTVGRVFWVSEFGAVGDGKTDDSPAVRRALAAAIKAGPGTTLAFEKKTYRMGSFKGGNAQMRLVDVNRLTIEGNGAALLLDPRNGILELGKCRRVIVRNFVIDFDPLPFTQGTIRAVDAAAGSFDLEIHEGHLLPPSDEFMKRVLGKAGWQYSSVIDPVENHRRWGIPDFFSIAAVNAVPDKNRTYRIKMRSDHAGRVKTVDVGDRFFLPLLQINDKIRAMGGNIYIRDSADCMVAGLTIHSARNGMVFSIDRNKGAIILRGNRIAFKPGSDRIVTTWKDGMHCKNNRVGPVIEDCYFEGMLDDSINLSADTAMASKVISPSEFRLVGPPFGVGDEVMVFNPRSNYMAKTKVIQSKLKDGVRTVVMADEIKGVVTGNKIPNKDIGSTHFYNMSYANSGFVVRNCVFKPQRRHAVLVRSCNGVIEKNRIDGVGGAAIWMANEIGNFYEGPLPQNNIIRDNIIRNTQWVAIAVEAGGGRRNARNIRIENNKIQILPGSTAIRIRNGHDIMLSGNTVTTRGGGSVRNDGIQITNSDHVIRQ